MTPLTPSMFARKNGKVVVITSQRQGSAWVKHEFRLVDGRSLNLSYIRSAPRIYGNFPEMGVWLNDGHVEVGTLKGKKEFNKVIRDIVSGRLTMINKILLNYSPNEFSEDKHWRHSERI